MLRGLRTTVRETAAVVWRQHASPGRLAAAVFVGGVIGASPLLGFHLPLCLLAAALLRLNLVAMYGAANVSLPVLLPALAFACVQCGAWLRHGEFLPISRVYFSTTPARTLASEFFVDWLLGGLIVGTAIGAVLALLVWQIARGRALDPAAAQQARVQEALARAARRYGDTRNVYSIYIWWKSRLDPCYAAIALRIPPASLTVDLGSGPGLLALTLHELGEARSVIAVERDSRRTAVARRVAVGADICHVEADIADFTLPECETVCLVDLLHYFPADAQRALMVRCAAALRPGGRLLIREMDGSSRSGALSRLIERLALPLGFTRADRVAPLTAADYRAALEAAGLAVSVEPLSGPLFPGNVLIEGVKGTMILER